MNYSGIIIEESLGNKSILSKLLIKKTLVEQVTKKHRTPWLQQWTLHTTEITEDKADDIAKIISTSLDKQHPNSWYVDYKNDKYHYIIFPDKIFKVDLLNPSEYKNAYTYGISIGIPKYQVNFTYNRD